MIVRKACKWILVSSLLLALSGMARAQSVATRGGVLFYAGFDGVRDAQANGDGKARLVDGGGTIIADGFGVRGGALRSGDAVGYVEFSAEGNLLPDEGTIEIWIKPEDWAADDKRAHVYVDIVGAGNIRFYKRADTVNCFMIKRPSVRDPDHFDDKLPGMVTTGYSSEQKKGLWRQYFLIWKKGELLAYYRGRLQPGHFQESAALYRSPAPLAGQADDHSHRRPSRFVRLQHPADDLRRDRLRQRLERAVAHAVRRGLLLDNDTGPAADHRLRHRDDLAQLPVRGGLPLDRRLGVHAARLPQE